MRRSMLRLCVEEMREREREGGGEEGRCGGGPVTTAGRRARGQNNARPGIDSLMRRAETEGRIADGAESGGGGRLARGRYFWPAGFVPHKTLHCCSRGSGRCFDALSADLFEHSRSSFCPARAPFRRARRLASLSDRPLDRKVDPLCPSPAQSSPLVRRHVCVTVPVAQHERQRLQIAQHERFRRRFRQHERR